MARSFARPAALLQTRKCKQRREETVRSRTRRPASNRAGGRSPQRRANRPAQAVKASPAAIDVFAGAGLIDREMVKCARALRVRRDGRMSTKGSGAHMTRFVAMRILGAIVAFAMTLGQADAQGRQNGVPGQFDYYVLSLSWSPSFCETATGNARRQQCGARPYAFVVHGLWPQFERGFPQSCQVPPPRLAHDIMTGMLDLMPAPGLIFHEWDQHGTCSGLQPDEYFSLVRKARARVAIPPPYANPTAPMTVTPGQVVTAFVGANEGLTAAAITIDCDRTRLREVRICLTRDLKFRDCSGGARRSCRSDMLTMPPVRGGTF